jgi:hypothetical protein
VRRDYFPVPERRSSWGIGIVQVARRYKIMNPDMMRSTYGKLMYLLQDAAKAQIRVRSPGPSSAFLAFSPMAAVPPQHWGSGGGQSEIGMALRCPVETVKAFAEALGCEAIFEDPLLLAATQDVRG